MRDSIVALKIAQFLKQHTKGVIQQSKIEETAFKGNEIDDIPRKT